jgi:hypothetical protein
MNARDASHTKHTSQSTGWKWLLDIPSMPGIRGSLISLALLGSRYAMSADLPPSSYTWQGPYRLEAVSGRISADLQRFLAPALQKTPIDTQIIETLTRAYYRIHGQPDMKVSSIVDGETGLVLMHLENPADPAKHLYSYTVGHTERTGQPLSQDEKDRRQQPLN